MVYPGDPLQGTMAVDDFGLGEVSLNFLYQSIRSGVKMARMNEANVEVEYQYTEAGIPCRQSTLSISHAECNVEADCFRYFRLNECGALQSAIQ
jgi:hypothetical protein